ncbi:MAG: zf-TFIIB domain-containing protein [Bacteroidota bacterium]
MNCPRCEVTLVNQQVAGSQGYLSVQQCPQCEGMWLALAERQTLEKIIEPVLWEIRQIPADVDQLAGLYCPSCTDHPLMVKADHHRDARVVVDYCQKCKGCWLDKGELTAIQQEQFLRSVYTFIRDLHA